MIFEELYLIKRLIVILYADSSAVFCPDLILYDSWRFWAYLSSVFLSSLQWNSWEKMSNATQKSAETSWQITRVNQNNRGRNINWESLARITTVKLDEDYLTWSQSAVLSIQYWGLYLYLTRGCKKPGNSDPLNDKWIAENSFSYVMVLHSMQPNISLAYMLLSTTYEIWLSASQT